MKLINRLSKLLLLVFLAVGCTDELLLENLSTKQSIEVLIRLQEAGVNATRVRSSGRGEKYSVNVSSTDISRALKIVHELGLPKKQDSSLEELTKPKGFVPNSKEISSVRLDRVLSLEVERIIEAFPGVIEAKAVVRSSFPVTRNKFEKNKSSSASIVIRYESETNKQPFTDDEIKEVVSKAVPGLDSERITLNTNRVFLELPSRQDGYVKMWPFSFEVKADSKRSVGVELAVGLILAVVCGLIAGFTGGRGIDAMGRYKMIDQKRTLLENDKSENLPE